MIFIYCITIINICITIYILPVTISMFNHKRTPSRVIGITKDKKGNNKVILLFLADSMHSLSGLKLTPQA
jgi:hypothetical protein